MPNASAPKCGRFCAGLRRQFGFSPGYHGRATQVSDHAAKYQLRAAERAHTNRQAPPIPPGQRSPFAGGSRRPWRVPRRIRARPGRAVSFPPRAAGVAAARSIPPASSPPRRRATGARHPAVRDACRLRPRANRASRAVATARCQNTSRWIRQSAQSARTQPPVMRPR